MTSRPTLILDGGPLRPDDVVAVAERQMGVELGPGVAQRMEPARRVVDAAVTEGRVVYGVTTGLGALSTERIDAADATALQKSLVRSHAAGLGPPLPPEMVRAMLLLRARTLAHGHSGVRVEIVERLVDFLRLDLLPLVPAKGSVGASGDLAGLAHLALPLIGEGALFDDGAADPAAEVLARHGLEPLALLPKEGLSLLNGTEGMAAFGVIGLHRMQRIARVMDIACAMTIEALMGSHRPFDARVHELRPHPGQRRSASNIAALLAGSEIGASHRDDFAHAVQDAYSLRCAPQVHGAARDVIDFAAGVLERELGSVTDNPLVFPDRDELLSAGNFHGQPLAFAMDFLAIAAADLCSISERRIDRLLDPVRSRGLPGFLAAHPGLHSGLMLAQYTAAALVAECRVLSHPASVDSIPTSGDKEDHVSMGWGAGRKLLEVLDALEQVVGIELICAAEGIGHRAPLRSASGTGAAVDAVRRLVDPVTEDRPLSHDMQAMADAVARGEIDGAVAAAGYPLQ